VKRFWIAALIALSLIGLITLYAINNSDTSITETPAPILSSEKSSEFKVNNLKAIGRELSQSELEGLKESIIIRIDQDEEKAQEASVRDKSLKSENLTLESGEVVQTVSFIVDIAEAKRSYVVDWAFYMNSDRNIINILCPNKDQLRYGEFSCEE
jgi:hypothetical protein